MAKSSTSVIKYFSKFKLILTKSLCKIKKNKEMSMHKSLIELALKTLSCTQKELAAKLNVSPTQITKWKQNEYMSHDMEEKLRELTHIDDMIPEFVLYAGNLKNAEKWKELLCYLAEVADENTETGYITLPLVEDENLLCWNIFNTLTEMGVCIPKNFPEELEFDYEEIDDDTFDLIMENKHANIIYDIFKSLTNIYGFYTAYIQDIILNDDMDLYETSAPEIEPCLMNLAACKIEVDKNIATKFDSFKYSTLRNYKDWLTIVKYKSMQAGIPLRAELLDLVYKDSNELGEEAESEFLEFNSMRLHPDIYMNELLTGMRAIHQILPFIMKKMGIYEEFKLDESDLYIGKNKFRHSAT